MKPELLAPAGNLEKLKWAELSTQVERKTASSSTSAGITTEAAYASRLGHKMIKEFPLSLSLLHQRNFLSASEILINTGYTFYNSDWRGYFGRLKLKKKLSEQINVNASIFHQLLAPPLGWREGRVMPFEYQPWTILIKGADSTFISESKPDLVH